MHLDINLVRWCEHLGFQNINCGILEWWAEFVIMDSLNYRCYVAYTDLMPQWNIWLAAIHIRLRTLCSVMDGIWHKDLTTVCKNEGIALGSNLSLKRCSDTNFLNLFLFVSSYLRYFTSIFSLKRGNIYFVQLPIYSTKNKSKVDILNFLFQLSQAQSYLPLQKKLDFVESLHTFNKIISICTNIILRNFVTLM